MILLASPARAALKTSFASLAQAQSALAHDSV